MICQQFNWGKKMTIKCMQRGHMQRDSIHQTDTQIYIQEVNSTAAQVETKACIGK